MPMNLFAGIDRHSIIFKITLRIALSSMGLMIILGVINTHFVQTEYRELEQEKLTTIMQDALKTLGVNLSYEFYQAVRETGEKLLEDKNIIEVRIKGKTIEKEFSFSSAAKGNRPEGFSKKMIITDPATGENIGELTVDYSRQHYRAMMLKYYRNLAILFIIYFLFACYLIRLLVAFLNPLAGLARQMHSFAPDQPRMRLPCNPENKDEVYHIAVAVNSMLDSLYGYTDRLNRLNMQLLKAQDELEKRVKERTSELKEKQLQLAHAGRLVAMGELATGIAHELGQPLQIIKTAAAIVVEEIKSDDMNQQEVLNVAAKIVPQIDRATTIINNMRTFARYDTKTEAVPVSLRKPLEECLGFFNEQFHQHEINISVDISEDLPKVRTETQKFQQIVVNLLSNARYAVDHKYHDGHVDQEFEKSIRVTLYYIASEKQVVLKVSDNGCGMTRKELNHCREPFFTTKPPDQGTGLGISIAYGIAREFGFELEIASIHGQGSIFTVKMDAVT